MYRPMLYNIMSPGATELALLAAPAVDDRRLPPTDQQPDQRVVFVCPVGDGEDHAANGANLLKVLGDIRASAGSPVLLSIAAGRYDLGATPLQMKAYVDIAGAGERATRLTSCVGARASGTVIGADDAELRDLTVANTGGDELAVAIYNNAASPRLTHVIAEASGALANNAIYNANAAAPRLTHVNALASGHRCNIGVYNNGAAPVMTDVVATAAGGYVSYGVYNYDSAKPLLTNVIATAAGADRNFGLFNDQDCVPAMINVVARALGGIDNIDLYNEE